MIPHTDKRLAGRIRERIDNLNKPKGSLGRLETLALQVALIQETLSPRLTHPCHILFGADHGIEHEGVSASPREVTWQQMLNYDRGGGGVNVFCRQHGFSLRVVDVGVDYDFDPQSAPSIIDRKIAHGTANFLHQPAMTEEQLQKAMSVGKEQVEECLAAGSNIVSFGEMGVGNTSSSSVLMHLIQHVPLADCVGAGSGLSSEGVAHKMDVLLHAVEHFRRACPGQHDARKLLQWFGGFEMAAAVGGMLRAAEARMIVLVDGFIMTACMMVARQMEPAVTDYAIFCHQGDERGHRIMLKGLGAQPLLSLAMRLGEGTGALCAFPIVDSAVRMLNEMDTFSHARITKYF